MPRMAQTVLIDNRTGALLVDGEEFPWLVAAEPSVYGIGNGEMPRLSLDLLAERIEVVSWKRANREPITNG